MANAQVSDYSLISERLESGERDMPARQAAKRKGRYWSGEVTKRSNALDLEPGVFTWKDPARIAASLKRSAEESTRRKGTPYQSAMSMLTFYINRAGKGHIAADQTRVLEQAKVELRRQFDKQ